MSAMTGWSVFAPWYLLGCHASDFGEGDCYPDIAFSETVYPMSSWGGAHSITVGQARVCALDPLGNMLCWGSPNDPIAESIDQYSQIDIGVDGGCGITLAGTASVWTTDMTPVYFGEAYQVLHHGLGGAAGLTHSGDIDQLAYDGSITRLLDGPFVQMGGWCGLAANGSVECPGGLSSRGPFAFIGGGNCGIEADGDPVCAIGSEDGPIGLPNECGDDSDGDRGAVVRLSSSGAGSVLCGPRNNGEPICWDNGAEVRAPEEVLQSVESADWRACGIRLNGDILCWAYPPPDELND